MTYRSKVAVVYLLGFFLDLINLFIASVAFPAMSVDLHTSISALAWVSNGYIAGLTLIVPFSAFLSRYLGARRLIIFSLILFSVAAAAAGFADSLHSLVFWRIVQGAGGGLLIPVGQALTWQQFKPHERAGVSSVGHDGGATGAGMFACDWRAAGGNVRLALDILCHSCRWPFSPYCSLIVG
ncbi:membrane protein [Salmonella enterica subsp. enterica]|uniref:Membrane protein n=1 Tax=Salmonella enterica I TaxID=59201 RepID=A0A379WMJ4_SALET|nr:membrane protein [Salmonella enterica subsp. enterica]